MLDEKGEPWFVARDVCEALDSTWNSNRIAHVPEEWKRKTAVVTRGGKQQLTTLSEQGLYFFLARSDKPKALPFQRWMAGEVLPAIHTAPTPTPPPSPPPPTTNNPVAVRTFSYGMLGDMRVIQDAKGEPWFVAADVCKYLGFDNNHTRMALQGLDEDEKATILKVVGRHDFKGLRKDALLVSEAGLYSLILRSRKPGARDFKRWVTHEVLPAVRRHGGYLTPDKLAEALLSPDTLIRLAHNLKAAQEKAEAEERLRLEAEEKLEAAQPKAEAYDKLVAPSRLSVAQFARRLPHAGQLEITKRWDCRRIAIKYSLMRKIRLPVFSPLSLTASLPGLRQ